MATSARLGHVEGGAAHPSRLWVLHLVAAAAVAVIGVVGLVLGTPGASVVALGAAAFLGGSAWYWHTDSRT